MNATPDVVVVGAGAIGASIAFHLTRLGIRVLILEKEGEPALHQSGRNSGVIHAGYNLKPGSHKAKFCVEGSKRLRQYCLDNRIGMTKGGILVVARSEGERTVLAELDRRAKANGVRAKLVNAKEIREIEPYVAGIEALHAPDGASVDSQAFVRHLLQSAEKMGAQTSWRTPVTEPIDTSTGGRGHAVIVRTPTGKVHATMVVNAAGLHADRIAGPIARDLRIVPFRGYYAELRESRSYLVRSHVYSAPDLEFPFLGVHASRRTDGRVLLGPGAMLAFGREAYRFHHANLRDLADTLTWPGFYRMLGRQRMRQLMRSEIKKSISLGAIAAEAKLLIPELQPRDLVRSFAGNRAQLVSRDGHLIDDIVVRETDRSIHVLNAVSPGLTCALPFGEDLARRCLAKLNGRATGQMHG